MAGRTTCFISHRLGALTNCDVLLKFDPNGVVELPVPDSMSAIETFVYGDVEKSQEEPQFA